MFIETVPIVDYHFINRGYNRGVHSSHFEPFRGLFWSSFWFWFWQQNRCFQLWLLNWNGFTLSKFRLRCPNLLALLSHCPTGTAVQLAQQHHNFNAKMSSEFSLFWSFEDEPIPSTSDTLLASMSYLYSWRYQVNHEESQRINLNYTSF